MSHAFTRFSYQEIEKRLSSLGGKITRADFED